MKTYVTKAYNSDEMKIVATALIERSAWFEVEPQPFDVWEITTKPENQRCIAEAILSQYRLTPSVAFSFYSNGLYHALKNRFSEVRARIQAVVLR